MSIVKKDDMLFRAKKSIPTNSSELQIKDNYWRQSEPGNRNAGNGTIPNIEHT